MTWTISYLRAPSERLRKLLTPGAFLAPLIALNRRKFKGTELDVHFRIKDEIQVYCGLTRVLTVQMLQRPDGHVRVDADPKYTRQPSAGATGLFGRWRVGDRGFSEAIEAYLDVVDVSRSFTEGEGAVQSQWSRATEPWVPFDREAALNYESMEHREETKKFPEVEAAFESIQAKARQGRWKELRSGAKKVDQLAVDPKGRLVLIELKDAKANDDRVYYVPFQLLQYVWKWHGALEAMRGDLQKLINARVAVKLTPSDIAPLTGGVRAAVGFGPDKRTAKVRHRCDVVLEIVNDHLPLGVAPIEMWEHTGSGPHLLP